jgi:CheY-like chemotaxis protein/PAS domain-containing protein
VVTDRDQVLLAFLRDASHHSALRGDPPARAIAAATRAMTDGVGATAVGFRSGPLVGADLLVAHELALSDAVAAAGLDLLDDPAGEEPAGAAWFDLAGIDGILGALRVVGPASGWSADGPERAFAADVVGELSQLLLRHWREQQHLDRSAALLEAQRHTHVGCFEWDIVADKVRWSDELFRIFGDEPQSFEPTFEEFLERIHEDDRDAVRASVYGAYEERRDYRIEERIVRPDGTVRRLASWGHVIVDEDTVPIKIIGSCQDVTDFRAAMAELARSERRLAEVQERRTRAMELNDNVVQGLAAALYALELGRTHDATAALTGTLAAARSIVDHMLSGDGGDLASVGLVRQGPAPSYLEVGERPAPAPRSGPQLRIVVADDSSDIRWLTSVILSAEPDFEVVAEAANGEEAVMAVEAHRPDLILLDLAMPVLDGLSAIPLLRDASPATTIVVFSGFNAGSAADEALGLGAAAFVEKGRIDTALPALLRTIRANAAKGSPLR